MTTTEVTTNIIVHDGHTILIGGLFRESVTSRRSQLPIIGNIPVVGALVRSTLDNTDRQEVIILLTVHVVKDDDALRETSLEAAEDVERFRVGIRKGLQWFGRERLAQAHYHWALEHRSKGHLGRASWDVNLAINNNPKFLAAASDPYLQATMSLGHGSGMRSVIRGGGGMVEMTGREINDVISYLRESIEKERPSFRREA